MLLDTEAVQKTESSDDEFWIKLDKEPSFTGRKLAGTKHFADRSTDCIEDFSDVRSSGTSDRYQKLISIVRTANSVELKNKDITTKAVLEKERVTMSLLEKYKASYKKAQEEIDDLKINLVRRDREVQNLKRNIADLTVLITSHRISHSHTAVHSVKPTTERTFLAQPSGSTAEADSMKKMLKMYKADLLIANGRIREFEESIKSIETKARNEVEAKLLSVSVNEERLKAELSDLTNKFSVFKQNASMEFDVREQLENRQLEIIKSLQEELKAAKVVMKNPRLRNKLQEMLKPEQISAADLSSSLRKSRMDNKDDFPKLSKPDFESPVKTRHIRARSSTQSPVGSTLNRLKVTIPNLKLMH